MAINVTPIPGLDPAINDIAAPDRRLHQRRDPAQRGGAVAVPAGATELTEDERETGPRAEHRAARGDQGQGQEGRAVGPASAQGVRRDGPRLPGPGLHVRDPGLRRRRRRPCSASPPPTRATPPSWSSTAPRSRSEVAAAAHRRDHAVRLLHDRAGQSPARIRGPSRPRRSGTATTGSSTGTSGSPPTASTPTSSS